MNSPIDPRVRAAARLVARLGLAAVFLVAGALKVREPLEFAAEIVNYRLLPDLAPYLAVTLPPIEVLTGLALLAPFDAWRRAGGLAAGALLVPFTIAVTAAVVRGINVSCGCFGDASGTVTWLTVGRDLFLLGMAAAVVLGPAPTTASSPHTAASALGG